MKITTAEWDNKNQRWNNTASSKNDTVCYHIPHDLLNINRFSLLGISRMFYSFSNENIPAGVNSELILHGKTKFSLLEKIGRYLLKKCGYNFISQEEQ